MPPRRADVPGSLSCRVLQREDAASESILCFTANPRVRGAGGPPLSSSPHQSPLEHERSQNKGKRAAHCTDDEVRKIALTRSG